jgi:nitrite reductase/ring-hydroxylating ferredoxin subunit
MGKHRLLPVGELTDGEIRPFEIDGHFILLVNGERGPALIDDTCPHAGGNLAKGKIVGNRIQCPTHRYLFDLETGSCPLGRREGWGPLAVHELLQSDGYLCVEFAD